MRFTRELMRASGGRQGGPRGARRSAFGFTLIEAMLVVAIIGVSAALAAPALGRAMAERRASESTHSLVALGVRARAESVAYGRAYLLVYTDSSSGGTNGSVTMWRGLVDRCSANDWAMLTSHTCGASGGACVDVLDMDTFAIGSNRVQMRLPGDPTYLCYEPNGELYVSTTAIGGPYSVTSPTDTTHQGVTFTLQRYEGTGAVGVTRRVVFPFGGEPRIVR